MEQRYKFNVLQEQKAYLEQVLREYDDQAAKKLPGNLEFAFWQDTRQRSISLIRNFFVKGTISYILFGLFSLCGVHLMLGISLPDLNMVLACIAYFNGAICLLSIVLLSTVPKLQRFFEMGVLFFVGWGIFVGALALLSVELVSMRWQGTIVLALIYTLAYTIPGIQPAKMVYSGVISSTTALLVLWAIHVEVDLWVYITALYLTNVVSYGVGEMIATKDRVSFIRAKIIQVDHKINEVLAKHLLQLSQEDDLTQLANRRNFDETYERLYLESQQHGSSLGVLFIDIDFFKTYNDHYGHQQGDVALAKVASMIKKSIRYDDFVARYGGEEFVVLLPKTDESGVMSVASNIVENVAEMHLPHAASQCASHVTVSVGGAVLNHLQNSAHISLEQLLHNADAALYMAKKMGRNRIHVYQHKEYSAPHPTNRPLNQGT